MTDITDTRDRVIALETDVKHLTAKVDEMAEKVNAVHDLLQQAKGVKWLIVTAAAVGGFVSAKLAAVVPWFGVGPR